ncbi:DUF3087 family protein [Thalassotalea atypica]|uniref:DUF3087 family protein n=1 Tax=Thalassotalea atypica TaxID=2054316 RepID=UPI0025739622|nr:DUF3087 family protein [Thalassotalea atypica]
MKLQDINKAHYRKRLNTVIAAFISCFALLAVIFGSLLITLFATPIVDPEVQSNFKFNIAGVIIALLTMSVIMNHFKKHPLMTEVYYVWQLKQIHNQIYRKLVKIKDAATEKDTNALVILSFYYLSLEQVYHLDNNTLTMSAVKKDQVKIQTLLGDKKIEQQAEQFQVDLIKEF